MGKMYGDLKVLIVDDDESSLKLLEARLQVMGFRNILKAGDGAQCLSLARAEQPDLIFLDVMMPRVDGGDVKRELADDARTRNIPIVFVTAIVTDKEVQSGGGMIGGNVYVAKPYDAKKLENAIKKVLGA